MVLFFTVKLSSCVEGMDSKLDVRLRQSLTTVRSLGSHGLRVAVLETSDSDGVPAFSSRWCQQRFVCPANQGTEAYLTYVEQLLDRTDARVLITSSDATIALIRRHREQLERRGRDLAGQGTHPGAGHHKKAKQVRRAAR